MPTLINNNLINYFPDTSVRQELIKKFYTSNNIIFFNKKIGNLYFNLNKKSHYHYAAPEDVKLGAQSLMFYNEGFCNEKSSIDNPYIISVGDSFTYCTQLTPNDSWVQNIFHNFNKENILNMGSPGTGPYQYNELLRGSINKNTKLVLYGYYEGNDLRDMINYKYKKKKYEENKKEDKNEYKDYIKKKLGNYYSLNLIYAIYKSYYLNWEKKSNENINFKYTRISSGKKFNTYNSDLDEVEYAQLISKKSRQYNQKILDTFSKILKENFMEAKNIAESNGSEIIFIYIPSAYTAFGHDVNFEDSNVGLVVNDYSKINQETFLNICKIENLNCINTVNSMIYYNLNSTTPTHFPYNVHLTKEGHQIVAKEIKDYICYQLENNHFFKKYCI